MSPTSLVAGDALAGSAELSAAGDPAATTVKAKHNDSEAADERFRLDKWSPRGNDVSEFIVRAPGG